MAFRRARAQDRSSRPLSERALRRGRYVDRSLRRARRRLYACIPDRRDVIRRGRPVGGEARVFSLSAEGKTLLRDFDPTAAAGPATAMEKVFTGIPVDDGRLELVFTASRDFPAVWALWLKQE
ncbi:hypothetical protein HS125_07275 [bacterium]|nr:hypothetical protein [bacterium]